MNKPMDSKLTPMMKQYFSIKKRHPNEILFFRMGDFYEMFHEDAHVASKILNIALTSRQDNIPMCGLPYHASESYIARLLKAGHRVAICEQMETVPTSGNVVKREVVRIVTPGTVVESNLLQSDDNNFLASIVLNEKEIGLAFIDISTGDFFLSSIEKSFDVFRGEIVKYGPRELVLREGNDLSDKIFSEYIINNDIPIYRINDWFYDIEFSTETIKDTFGLASIKGFGITTEIEILAAGSILQYLKDTHKKTFDHLKSPRRFVSSDYMILDEETISNMELVQNQHDRSKNYTLFSVLDCTKTAIGRRTLERNILNPLLQQQEIEKRLDIVEFFFGRYDLISNLQKVLYQFHDTERLISRFNLGRSFPKDYITLMNSIDAAREIGGVLIEESHPLIIEMLKDLPDLSDLSKRIECTITDDPALSPERGRVIKEGCNDELDHLYKLKMDAKKWMLEYEREEKNRIQVPTLRVKYNKVLGYFIEVSKGQTSKVPDEYYRKQTLVSSERYSTEKLQKFESDILTASDRIITIENTELENLLAEVLQFRNDLQIMADIIGEIDFYCSMAQSAIENKYRRPTFNSEGISIVKEGRHPVVEKYYSNSSFVPNDIILDTSENIIVIITGPNMSGKSTYIRMTAMIQLMAQIGSFVPADEAYISLVDRIFTRIGASDNISRGESTFLVEMNETAVILNNATDKSLIIMDEIGRGTSTYDGLSIAWAVVEYLLKYVKARTLFATHYHELTRLGNKKGIVNYNVLVREHINGIDFLHKVAPGSADKSYGIHVAKLAGIPKEVSANAAIILDRMEKGSRGNNSKITEEQRSNEQLEIFNASNHHVIKAIKNINLDNITPLNALNELNRLKKLID